MDHLAIVIGISEYENGGNLSACFNDADMIYSILENTEKYKEILFLKGSVKSSSLKEKLIEFSKKYENQEIEELFFYFSGHGYANENDFYFCTTDVDTAKINSTSLQNTELDTFIRKIEPKLYIKVVDACFSGTHYIKGVDFEKEIITTIFQKSIKQKAFENVYFFYSSHSNQTSKATNEISIFTDSFISCIKQAELSKSLRYKAIIDFLTDSFKEDEKQKPYFIIQGDMTETFCTITEKTMQSINKDKAKQKAEEDSFKKIKALLKQHPTKEEIKQTSEKIQKIFEEFKLTNSIISKEYKVLPEYKVFTKSKLIGEWIEKNKSAYHLLAIPIKNRGGIICSYNNNTNDFSEKQSINITSPERSIPKFILEITYLYSFYTIYILYQIYLCHRIDWRTFEDKVTPLNELSVCEIQITKFDDSESKKIYTILAEFEKCVLNSLEEYLEQNDTK